MSKKGLIALICLAVVMFSIVSCSNEAKTDETGTDAVTTVATDTTAEATAKAEDTTEAETEAPKPKIKFQYIDFYEEKDDGGHDPRSISDTPGSSVGAKFTAEGNWIDISMNCPSWSDNIGTMTFAVYNWDTDFETTVAAEPVYTTEFVDYIDNDTLIVEFEGDGLPPGTYLWLLKDGKDGVGIWSKNKPDDPNIEVYYNGQVADFGPEAIATVRLPNE
ncbi:MAG: hypothetical protein GX067_06830 [Clostridiales bacterium]|nr:hypothetical protein [Clostridiales bacterium]